MEKYNNLIRFETENGDVVELILFKEFIYKKNKYGIALDIHECSCEEGCNGKDECDCEDGMYVLKMEKDLEGNDIFKIIENDKEYSEIIKEVEKILEDN